MSRRKEMMHIFETITNINFLSKYSNSLSKLLYKNCLKDYVSSLKDQSNGKIKKNSTLLSLDNISKKKKELNLLTDDGTDDEKNNLEKKEKQIKIIKKNKNFSKTIDILDPFKYHPNYNSIFKNIHSFKIVEHKTLSLKNKNDEIHKMKMHKIKIKNLNLDIDNNDLILNNKHNLEEFKSCKSDSSLSISKKKLKSNLYKTLPDLNKQTKNFKIKTESKFDFNNIRRFSKYSPRKINIYKVNNKLTYIEPYRYSFINRNNKSIDFKKMAKRNSNILIHKQILKNPSIYNYHPKYDLIEQRLANIIFNKNDIQRRTKKYLIKKLWSSFNPVKDYLLIDNNKLNNDIKVNIQ